MRDRWVGFGTVLAGVLAVAGSVRGAEPPRAFEIPAIDAYVSATVRERKLPGVAVAIARDGAIVLAKGYGLRSLEGSLPVEPGTPFAAGSVTKQFACASILILAEEGKLGVEDKVAKYFPDLTAAKDVTLYQLMTHTSGYPDYYPLDFVDRRLHRPIEPDALIRQYAGGKLDFPPGTRWSYSNTGYTILGRVVEKVSGESFANFVKRRILDPVGMTHSAVDPAPGEASRARGYLSFALGAPEPARPETGGWLYAAGGLWASAPDLASWDLALMEGRVLPHDAFRRMATPVPLADGRVRDYGCGQNITRRGGETVLTHGGAISGFRAFNALVPRTKSAVVVLVNSEQPDDNLGQNLLNLVLKADAPASDVPKVTGPAPAEAALAFFRQMAAGTLDRSQLGEEFSAYLSDERVLAAAPRLRALGEPEHVTVASVGERGGMEVASIHLTFKGSTLTGLLYRSTDGKIQQLLFDAD